MQRFLLAHQAVLPLLLLAVVVAWLLAGRLAGRVRGGRAAGAALVLACLGPVVLTLAPQLPLDLDAGRACATYIRPYRWWGQGGEEVANALLLVPVGVLAPMVLRARYAVVLLVVAAGFPWAVELAQYLLPLIGRECDPTDVFLNCLGLAAGVVVGLVGALVLRQVGR